MRGFEQIEVTSSAVLLIDLAKIVENYNRIAAKVAPAKVYPVVKANAYGLGLEKVALSLYEAGAEAFFVAHLNEALALRQLIPNKPIYVFYGLCPGQADLFAQYRITPVINSLYQLSLWQQTKLEAVVHVDSGLNRLGFPPSELLQLQPFHSRINMLMSHLACAEQPDHPHNEVQLKRFKEVTAEFSCPKSLSASSGAYLDPQFHFDIVRAGIGLYGGNPTSEANSPLTGPVSLYARLLQIKELKKNEKVGYGATFTAPHPMRLGILGYGYADGYLRQASNQGSVFVNNNECPILGRISMDLMAIDLTNSNAAEGDWVELIGENLSLDKVALSMRTISYEVITSLHTRAQRIYI